MGVKQWFPWRDLFFESSNDVLMRRLVLVEPDEESSEAQIEETVAPPDGFESEGSETAEVEADRDTCPGVRRNHPTLPPP